jgi:hypothetical protein
MAKIDRSFVIDSSRNVAATGVTPAIEVAQDDGYSFQTVFTGLAPTASGTVTLQVSLDNVNFADYTGSAQNFASGTSNLIIEVTSKRHRYARLKFGPVSAGTGTCTTTFFGEAFTE